jgi:histidinol-phosphate aminotransferase
MKKIYRHVLDEITPYEPGKPIDEVKRELGLGRVFKLASNENPFPPSRKVMDAMSRAALAVNRYPDGGCYHLRQALSDRLKVPGENIIFGNGSDELIILALRAFVRPGEEVIISDPTFMVYKIGARVVEADIRVVPSVEHNYDLEGILEAITPATRMIFIANPENPVGSYIDEERLRRFIERLPRHVVLFLDEAYYEYAAGGDYPETLKWALDEGKSVMVSRTFSKAYGLAGLRLGYVVSRGELAGAVNKVREPFNVNSIAQAAAMAALDDEQSLCRSIEHVRKEKQRLYRFFESLGLKYVPSRTNFVLVDTGTDSVRVFDHMLREGIIIREMSSWGMKGYIRVTIGTEEENDRFLAVFKKAVRDK